MDIGQQQSTLGVHNQEFLMTPLFKHNIALQESLITTLFKQKIAINE